MSASSAPARFGWWLPTIGILVGAALIWFGVTQARLRAELETLRADNATLRAKLAAPTAGASRREVAAERGTPAQSPSGAAVEPSAARETPTPPAARAESKRRVNREDMAAMVDSPVMQKILATQTAALTQMTYARLMDGLQLSPEERDYFQRLLVEKQSNIQNFGMQFTNPGLTAEERQALTAKIQEAWTTGEAKIREFLNDENDFATYRKYRQQEPERKEIGIFEASLPETDAVAAATSDSLAALQSEARKNFQFTVDFYDQRNFGNPSVLNTASVQRFLDEQTAFQSEIADKAAPLLTPSQLAAFKKNQAATRQMMNMQLTTIVQMASGR